MTREAAKEEEEVENHVIALFQAEKLLQLENEENDASSSPLSLQNTSKLSLLLNSSGSSFNDKMIINGSVNANPIKSSANVEMNKTKRQQHCPDDARLFVGNVGPSVGERDLRAVFEKYGRVLYVEHRGHYASIQFASVDEMQNALDSENDRLAFEGVLVDLEPWKLSPPFLSVHKHSSSSALSSSSSAAGHVVLASGRISLTNRQRSRSPVSRSANELPDPRRLPHGHELRDNGIIYPFGRDPELALFIEDPPSRSFVETLKKSLRNCGFLYSLHFLHSDQLASLTKYIENYSRAGACGALIIRCIDARHEIVSRTLMLSRRPDFHGNHSYEEHSSQTVSEMVNTVLRARRNAEEVARQSKFIRDSYIPSQHSKDPRRKPYAGAKDHSSSLAVYKRSPGRDHSFQKHSSKDKVTSAKSSLKSDNDLRSKVIETPSSAVKVESLSKKDEPANTKSETSSPSTQENTTTPVAVTAPKGSIELQNNMSAQQTLPQPSNTNNFLPDPQAFMQQMFTSMMAQQNPASFALMQAAMMQTMMQMNSGLMMPAMNLNFPFGSGASFPVPQMQQPGIMMPFANIQNNGNSNGSASSAPSVGNGMNQQAQGFNGVPFNPTQMQAIFPGMMGSSGQTTVSANTPISCQNAQTQQSAIQSMFNGGQVASLYPVGMGMIPSADLHQMTVQSMSQQQTQQQQQQGQMSPSSMPSRTPSNSSGFAVHQFMQQMSQPMMNQGNSMEQLNSQQQQQQQQLQMSQQLLKPCIQQNQPEASVSSYTQIFFPQQQHTLLGSSNNI